MQDLRDDSSHHGDVVALKSLEKKKEKHINK